MIGALYVVLTLISAMFGLSSGVIQVRISEMLCVLPVYTAAAIPGVTVGCLLANLIVGGTVWDIVFGTLATLIGAVGRVFHAAHEISRVHPDVVSNMIIIPTVLILSGLGGWNMFPYFALTVGLGEIISCGVFGDLMVLYFERHPSVVKTFFDTVPVTAVEKV